MYKLGVNYEYSVNKLREYNNSTSIKRSGGETKRSSATGSALLQAFKEISKTNTERTLPNKNEQKTNGANSISTGFELLCSVVRRNLRYTPHLCSHLRHAALYGVFRYSIISGVIISVDTRQSTEALSSPLSRSIGLS